VLAGNLIQLGGIVSGVLLIVLAAAINGAAVASAALAVVGIVLVAFSSHSIGHWLAGRLVGLRFAYVGVRGTDHPETYPPPIRQIFSTVPMFTMVSTRSSRQAAGRWALAAYFAAGQTTAVVGWVLSAALARALNVPAARFIFLVVLAWALGTVLVAVLSPKGDYAKARAALGTRSVA
jgi:hypothetical protein